jgi:hypothetical protein
LLYHQSVNQTPMQNKHLSHPEDTILTGDLSVLDWFTAESYISLKIDGSPALVWGTNPENGKFFVCTKAAFNKQKIRLCYNKDDVFQHFGHQPKVAQILISCLDFLPRTEQVYQGDWIGFGGLDTFKPNTITYKFPEVVRQDIIIAPHTYYIGERLPEMEAHPITSKFVSTKNCLFVQTEASICPYRDDIHDFCKFAKQMSTLCTFVNDKQAKELKKVINSYIREGKDVNEDEIVENMNVDINLLRLWKLIESIKMDMFIFIDCNTDINCEIGNKMCDHEGYVMHNKFGSYKIVNRDVFSYNNFNLEKSW